MTTGNGSERVLPSEWLAGYFRVYPPYCRVTVKRKRAQWARIVAALAKVDEEGR